MHFEVGDGRKILFWNDLQCRDIPPFIAFLDKYNIAVNNTALVANYLTANDAELMWKWLSIRALKDWEMGAFMELVFLLIGPRA